MLEARDIEVRFSGGIVAVDGVTIEVQSGELLALCGPNGSGKSTIVSVLSGDRKPTSGSVLIEEKPLDQLDATTLARKRAVLEQSPTLSAPFSVEQLTGLSIDISIPPAENRRIVDRALADVSMEHLRHKRADLLSGGECHRAHLARVLSQLSAAGGGGGSYLLLDEPTSSLDIEHQISVMTVARRAASRGAGVLVVLHDLNLAAAYASRVGLMCRGKMIASGTPPEVFTTDRLSDVYRTPINVTDDREGLYIRPRFG